MKAFEVTKNEARSVLTHGRIMMAVEGGSVKVMQIVKTLKLEGYNFTDCAEEGDKEDEIAVFFVVDRTKKADFMSDYKKAKRYANMVCQDE